MECFGENVGKKDRELIPTLLRDINTIYEQYINLYTGLCNFFAYIERLLIKNALTIKYIADKKGVDYHKASVVHF